MEEVEVLASEPDRFARSEQQVFAGDALYAHTYLGSAHPSLARARVESPNASQVDMPEPIPGTSLSIVCFKVPAVLDADHAGVSSEPSARRVCVDGFVFPGRFPSGVSAVRHSSIAIRADKRTPRAGNAFCRSDSRQGASMNGTAHIGPTISIKGEVTSEEPLTIAGHVDGSVEVAGHTLTIVEGGRATATLRAATIVVSGAVQGSLCANEKIVVSSTAVIEGDLAAPALSLSDGAKVQGRIDTGDRGARELHLAS